MSVDQVANVRQREDCFFDEVARLPTERTVRLSSFRTWHLEHAAEITRPTAGLRHRGVSSQAASFARCRSERDVQQILGRR